MKTIGLKQIRNVTFGLLLLVVGVGTGYYAREVKAKFLAPNNPVRLERAQMDFSQFWQVWDRLEKDYVDPNKIDHQKMIYGAIAGMTEALGDPYTLYLPPAANQGAKEDLNGEFEGVGIQLGYIRQTVAVQTPLENHPAIKAGVKAGDLILHIKDSNKQVDLDTTNMTLEEAVKLIRGKSGTEVTLTFFREEKGTFEKTIIREKIVMPSVELQIGELENDEWVKKEEGSIAWVRIYRFGDNTGSQWDEAVIEILRQKEGMKGIVLDLRNNPGGYLQTSVDIASDFIAEGAVVKQQGRNNAETYNVSRRARLLGMPMTVLINGGSASASEILAGALRDRVGATLVGEKSFGKGTVQAPEDFNNGAGLHITVGKWLLPGGDWIQEKGLTPKVEVKLPNEASESAKVEDTQLKRAILELK